MKTTLCLCLAPLAAAFAQPLTPPPPSVPTIRVDTRLVEIYATVLDHKGRFVPGLTPAQFEVLDAGKPQRIHLFETSGAALSLGIVLDTTGSMAEALPLLKAAVCQLIDQLRPADQVAVYGFNQRLDHLQDFTTDHRAAKLAARRIRAEGRTALFDTLARVSGEITARSGKKAIVLFTDGDDNASVINLENAVRSARRAGVPIYCIAQGEALKARRLLNALETIAGSSGALAYEVTKPSQMARVFDDIAAELRHTYLIAYQTVPENGRWKPIQVSIRDQKQFRVRCREGYFAE